MAIRRGTTTCTHRLEELSARGGDIDLSDIIIEVEAEYHWYHRDAVMYLRNGDPGYPAEDDFEVSSAKGRIISLQIYWDGDLGRVVVREHVVAELSNDQVMALIPSKVWDDWTLEAMEQEPDDPREPEVDDYIERRRLGE